MRVSTGRLVGRFAFPGSIPYATLFDTVGRLRIAKQRGTWVASNRHQTSALEHEDNL